MMKWIVAWVVVAGVAGLLPAMADRGSPLPDWRDGNLTFYLDNDLFIGTDQNYTNGARLSWISGERPVSDLGSVQRFLRRLSGDEESFELVKRVTGFGTRPRCATTSGFADAVDVHAGGPGTRTRSRRASGRMRAGWGWGFPCT